MKRLMKMTSVAQINPYKSVDSIVLDVKEMEDSIKLLGVKNVKQVNQQFIQSLEHTHKYQHHTLDKSSFGGRAIDLQLINPITGRYMTGSSSGTAINVFLGINDIGIGVDGGGSVLAPAMSLNLFGFVSPLIDSEYMNQFKKVSTDGIPFKPSIGYMTYTYELLTEIIEDTLTLPKSIDSSKIFVSHSDNNIYPFETQAIEMIDALGERDGLILFLRQTLPQCDMMITNEGPIDLFGFGDTVFGHFDETTKEIQKEAKKGYCRVVNMANATAICIPKKELAQAYLLISESKPEKIAKLLSVAKELVSEKDELVERYFRDLDLYFTPKYNQ